MTETAAGQLARLIARGELLVLPGVYDGLSARVAEEAGFECLYVSGGAIARSCGLPDLGLLSMTEVRDRIASICDAVSIPVVVDIDTGYGNALNVHRTAREFARLGAAAFQLEDQVTPKKCGHYAGKELIGAAEMVGKIQAAQEARGDGGPLLIARTDAVATEGLESAVDRARRYAAAGAEILFVEAPTDREQITAVARELTGHPLLINMFEGGRTPVVPPDELAALGYRIVIVPSDLQRAAIHAMRTTAAELRQQGSTAALSHQLTSFDERDVLIGKPTWDERERRYGSA
ncbi:MAG: isocitrate lyase [Streptosporangiales bacterium]|nr:isocitrate lyase [Streptosporangiales bacterium]